MDYILEPFESLENMILFYKIRDQLVNESLDETISIYRAFTGNFIELDKVNSHLMRIQYMPILNVKNLFEKLDSLDNFIHNSKKKNISVDLVKCMFCFDQKLQVFNTFESVLYSLDKGPQAVQYTVKKCSRCMRKFYLSFYSDGSNERKFYFDSVNKSYFSFSNRIIFDSKILDSLTVDIMFKHSSFKAFTNSYNYFHSFYNKSVFPKLLEEKRISECWFYYKYLKTSKELEENNVEMFYLKDINHNISNLNKKLSPYFTSKWSGNNHTINCKADNCSQIISIDGNYKINRLKCFFSSTKIKSEEFGKKCLNFNLIQKHQYLFRLILENIEIGCLNTPIRGSYFCEEHKKLDPNFKFRYGEKFFQCNLSQIKQKNGIISKQKLKIYDSFLNNKDQIFYLVDYQDDCPFWISEKVRMSEIGETVRFNIKKFDGNDFVLWKDKVLNVLNATQCSEAIKDDFNSETLEKKLKNEIAKLILMTSIEDRILRGLTRKTSQEIWKSLLNRYENKNIQNIMCLRKRILNSKQDDDESVEEFVDKVQNLREEIEALGHKMTE
ncbi:unnamed protein product [Brachionus calyciflorus]|uniref:CxC5 like cysteine cluster associated with KDZ domain-containing protein n=1 Tax=Brachionus calyciflorus TaxID=104777 RepID=A0A814K7C6_9BILA|nr:unnamed protein product [Brachionus calyciflorus]